MDIINENKFYTRIWTQGNSLIITIPSDFAKRKKFKVNDTVLVLIKKAN